LDLRRGEDERSGSLRRAPVSRAVHHHGTVLHGCKRFVIETVLDILKSGMGLEHSRHRSVINAMVHVLSCLVAYAFRPGKPSISLRARQIKAYP
jgi:hypothetical protein